MMHMAKGIFYSGLTIVVLIIAGAVLYEPITTIINAISGVAEGEAANQIAGLNLVFPAAIGFGIICAFLWVFLWSHKYEYERY